MIREYINELLLENDEKLKKLEQQLKNSMDDLDCTQKWLKELQSEANADKNIFSPRAMDANLEDKTKEVQNNIDKLNQDIEYVKSFMETHLIKRQEYVKLLEELDEMIGGDKQKIQNDNITENRHVLKDLYDKTDLCLSLLYDDRIRCKNELKNMRSMIRNMLDSSNGNQIS